MAVGQNSHYIGGQEQMNIRKFVDDIHSAEFELLEKKLSLVAEKAYQKGVEDGQSKTPIQKFEKEHHARFFKLRCRLSPN